MNIDLKRVFEEADENIRSDILLLIIEHLNREKLFTAATVLEDEVGAKLGGVHSKRVKVSKFHKAVLNGDWDACVKLLSTLAPKSSQRCFLYFLLRQQYLELIDNGEHERAFPFLTKHLKPLEDIAVSQGARGEVSEFKELCYLLTCSAIGEAEGAFFRWVLAVLWSSRSIVMLCFAWCVLAEGSGSTTITSESCWPTSWWLL